LFFDFWRLVRIFDQPKSTKETAMIPHDANRLTVEQHAAIYSLAILVLFKLVPALCVQLAHRLSQQSYRSLVVYLCGLCAKDKNQTCLGIAKRFGLVSHDALTRMLTDQHWTAMMLLAQMLSYALKIASGNTMSCWLVLDDVLIPKKYARKMPCASFDYDYVEQRTIRCLRAVVLVWTNGTVLVPVAFCLWHKRTSVAVVEHKHKYRTKNEIARLLIAYVAGKGLRFDFLAFDSWYASAENLAFCHHLSITFVCALKTNRQVRLPVDAETLPTHRRGGRKQYLRKLCTDLSTTYPESRSWHYYERVGARARKWFVRLKGVPCDLLLVGIKNYVHTQAFKDIVTKAEKKAKDPNKYLVTNRLDWTCPELIQHYRKRWVIEVFFRSAKQYLGLTRCQAQTVELQTKHIALCFVSYVVLDAIRQRVSTLRKQTLSLEQTKHALIDESIVVLQADEHIKLYLQSRRPMDRACFEMLSKNLDFPLETLLQGDGLVKSVPIKS
jgi:SRSO17 transposase